VRWHGRRLPRGRLAPRPQVAIKVLPHARGEHFRRFEREARTIGSLNHPNLLTLHDVGEYDGVPFLVTEMLDGESLRARLSRGPLRLREAIQIGADVARGLAAATMPASSIATSSPTTSS